jgi:glutamate N-acetyltransferase/amino-acid N-acetyltransferase
VTRWSSDGDGNRAAARAVAGRPWGGELVSDGFELAPGFRARAVSCGLKPSGALDLALVSSERDCAAAAVFTENHVQAAPVLLDRETMAGGAARIRAVIANAGCANACTGDPGLSDARRMAALTAAALGCAAEQVLVLSTGVIGRRLDMERLARGIAAVARAAPDADAAARAILTTDTRPKTAVETVATAGGMFRIAGFAKGAGMIHPRLATLLAVLTTDARLGPAPLDRALRAAVDLSFNRVSVDGDTSTNDTVLLLASGASGIEPRGADLAAFAAALERVSVALARQIARDGEGATRLVEIRVSGARDADEAHRVADRIARSPLFKSAVHGGDPNWGRILAAAGSSGVAIDPARLALSFGSDGGPIPLVVAGLPLAGNDAAAAAALARDPVEVHLELGLGEAEATVWTCDLSAEYVAINAHYTT